MEVHHGKMLPLQQEVWAFAASRDRRATELSTNVKCFILEVNLLTFAHVSLVLKIQRSVILHVPGSKGDPRMAPMIPAHWCSYPVYTSTPTEPYPCYWSFSSVLLW